MPAYEQWLLEHGFRVVGEWRTVSCRVHHHPDLKGRPGLYAFVSGRTVCYIGKADVLHRRLRNYSNRCFRPTGTKGLRSVHAQITRAINAGRTIKVYAMVAAPEVRETITELEARLIREVRPRWNRTIPQLQLS
jgi:excinuclease UvrABC nuclease subunit